MPSFCWQLSIYQTGFPFYINIIVFHILGAKYIAVHFTIYPLQERPFNVNIINIMQINVIYIYKISYNSTIKRYESQFRQCLVCCTIYIQFYIYHRDMVHRRYTEILHRKDKVTFKRIMASRIVITSTATATAALNSHYQKGYEGQASCCLEGEHGC